MTADLTHSRRRWVILAVGTLAQAATGSFLYGVALIVPSLRADDHVSLVGASFIVSAPSVGLLFTLILWGAIADRYGERLVIFSGVGLAAVFLVLASRAHSVVLLCVLLALAGAGGASVNAASGRVVMGWFSVKERGLAMGARQTAQPLGVALGAIGLPPLAHRFSANSSLLYPAILCAVIAVAVLLLVVDPPRPVKTATTVTSSPYGQGSKLWRVHLASSFLVVPQFAIGTFTLVYLVSQRHWDSVTAGRMIFGFQLAGAAGRIFAGVWSDRVGSRLRPMRQLAVASAALMGALALGTWTGGWWIIVVFGLAAVVTVADNGLAFVAVAEMAGSAWAGRSLGIHNTGQNVAAMVTPPLLALIIDHSSYGVAFAVVGVVALIAVPVTPVRAERQGSQPQEWRAEVRAN